MVASDDLETLPIHDLCRRQKRTILVMALVLAGLFGWLVTSRIELFYATNNVTTYRGMWLAEVAKRRSENTGARMANVESLTSEITTVIRRQPPEVRNDVQKRLAGIRLHFLGGVRDVDLKCPPAAKPSPAPTPHATPTPDAPTGTDRGLSEQHLKADRMNVDRLTALQAWVRKHMVAYHGVVLP